MCNHVALKLTVRPSFEEAVWFKQSQKTRIAVLFSMHGSGIGWDGRPQYSQFNTSLPILVGQYLLILILLIKLNIYKHNFSKILVVG